MVAISNYKITKRKDGRNYVRLQDGGDITHIYGKTKSEVQAMLDRRQEPFVPLCEKNPAVDENISRMVDRMLAYDPEMRPKYPEIIRVLK